MPRLLFRRWCHLVVVVLALSSVLVHCASGSSSNDPSSMFQLNPRVENNTKTNANGGGGDDDSSKPRKTSSDKEEKTTGVDDGDDDDLIIKNPSFIPSDDDGSSSDGEDDESSNDATEDEEQEELLDIDDEEEYEEEEDESDAETLGFPTPKLSDIKAAKKAFDGALTKTSKQSKKYIKLAKKHKASITVAITVIAFRREIMKTLAYFWRKQFVDPKTGKFDWKRINITNLVKLILIADAIRKVYLFRNPPDTEEGNYNAENHVKLIVALSTTYPILGILFTNFTPRSMYNPSYVPPIEQHWMFERINERYVKDGMALSKSIQASHEKLKWPSSDTSVMAKAVAQKSNSVKVSNPNEPLIILDWTKLDPSVSSMERLRDQVSFLLSQYRKAILESSETNMEVVVKLESPGGSVADYGLAAEQLIRLRDEPGITLTICVDKVAASGGYMLAVTSSPGRLFAAPFAMLGSIGVVAQVLNFHKALEGYGVTDIVLRSGKGKAPLGNLGEITKDQKDRSQKMIDAVHVAFKKHVVKNRPELKGSIDKIGNGDVWLGVDALEKKLVDRITTSDEYICQRIVEGARCLLMVPYQKHHRAIGGPFSPAQFMRSIESMFLKAVDSLGVNQLLEGRPGPKEQSLRLSASSSSDLFPKAKM